MVVAAGTAAVVTEIAASNGAVAETKDADVVAGAAEDGDEEAEGDVVLRWLRLSELVAEVSALVPVEDPVVSAPVTERNMCDPEEPPAVCETCHWIHLQELVALLR